MSLPLSNKPSLVKESFANMSHSLEILPIFSKKRLVKLNRTKYQITEKKGLFSQNACQINLPSIREQENSYELNLETSGERDYYVLKLISGNVFKLNGNWVKEAILMEEDEIIIGHNKLKIVKLKSDEKLIDEIEIPIRLNFEMPVLIEGETGVGKSTLAKKLHEDSNASGEFIHLNLSSIPINLIESELFGHCKGAFTGAISNKIGAFKLANNGTIFLDEIDSLSLELQLKLLLFLDTKKIRPVGSVYEEKCNVQIIFASGCDLWSLVQVQRMRHDFFFRISSGFVHKIKPIRENIQIILEMIRNIEVEKNVIFSENLKNYYQKYSWPGNIRQLKGHLLKKILLSKSRKIDIDENDYLLNRFSPSKKDIHFEKLKEVKRRYVEYVYYSVESDIEACAIILGISSKTVKTILNL